VIVRWGDIWVSEKPNSIILHTFFVDRDGLIRHSPGPTGVFGYALFRDVLVDVLVAGGKIWCLHPTPSLAETLRRSERADQIMGTSWWNKNCHQTTDFIVGLRNQFLV
jgi:hypothetical protein